MSGEDEEEMIKDFDFKKVINIMAKVKEVVKLPNKTYTMECPECGGEMYAGKSSNGHHHIHCDDCKIQIMQ